MKSTLEETLLQHIRLVGLPEPEREYRFHPVRRWRADFAYPDKKLLIEVEGGTWGTSRHTTGAGYSKDCEKYNQAVLMGYKVLRYTSNMINSGQAINEIEGALNIKTALSKGVTLKEEE